MVSRRYYNQSSFCLKWIVYLVLLMFCLKIAFRVLEKRFSTKLDNFKIFDKFMFNWVFSFVTVRDCVQSFVGCSFFLSFFSVSNSFLLLSTIIFDYHFIFRVFWTNQFYVNFRICYGITFFLLEKCLDISILVITLVKLKTEVYTSKLVKANVH